MARKKNKKVAFEISIAGITTAFIVIALLGANYSPVAKLSFFAIAGVSLTLPLIAGSFWGTVMAYLAGGALSLIFSPVNVVPFAFIFGLQVIVMHLCKRFLKNKWYICIPIKLILFNVALFGVFKLYGFDSIIHAFERFGWEFKYVYAALICSPLYVLYDYAVQYVYRWLGRRLIKLVKYNPELKEELNGKSKEESSPSEQPALTQEDGEENELFGFSDNNTIADNDSTTEDNEEDATVNDEDNI